MSDEGMQRALVELQQEVRDLRARQMPAVNAICTVSRTSSQVIPDSTLTALEFDTQRYDPYSMYDVADPTRITCRVPGLYGMWACVRWEQAAGGRRTVRIRMDGSIDLVLVESGSVVDVNHVCVQNLHCVFPFGAFSYVELIVNHNQGGDLDIEPVSDYSPNFGVYLLY